MSTLRSLRRRMDKLEAQKLPPAVPPFHVLDGSQSQAEIEAIEREVADYEQRYPSGPPAFIIRCVMYGDS